MNRTSLPSIHSPSNHKTSTTLSSSAASQVIRVSFISIQLEDDYRQSQVQRQAHLQMAKQFFLFVASSNRTSLDGVLLEQTPG